MVDDLQDFETADSRGINTGVTFNVSGQDGPSLPGLMDTGSTTIGGFVSGHEREQQTRGTIGGGPLVVGGVEQTAENSTVAVNRDLNQSQVVTVDRETGGLNASVTVDHRLLTVDGQEELLNQFQNFDDNVVVVTKASGAQLLGLTAAAGGFVSGDQTLSQAVATLSNPLKVDRFVSEHPEQAAVLEAFRNGDYEGLPKTKDGLQSLADFLDVDADILLTTVTAQIGVSGATDGSLVALDVSLSNRTDIIQTTGHEFQHVNGVDSEWLSDIGGLSTSLAFNAAALRDQSLLTRYSEELSNRQDRPSVSALKP